MTITLPDNLERIVQRHMESGRYPAPADVVAAALDLLDADTDADDAANTALRAAIAVGDADIAAGRVAPFDPLATLARVRARRSN